ncbi:LysR family transcriptional regulator [Streptomyces violaceus]|uniref:LysR family transcriptional regulator n=1 Tax=Streptomyces violaceus TaxID=1936 RepID=UPI002E24DECA
MCGVASWHAPFVGSPQNLRQRQLTYRGIAKGERCRTHDQYRLLLHLAETLSFTRTAADCHVSPATLSRTVQRLAAATGHRLLDRGPHGVCLTTHGRAFRQYAAEAWTSGPATAATVQRTTTSADTCGCSVRSTPQRRAPKPEPCPAPRRGAASRRGPRPVGGTWQRTLPVAWVR